MGMVVDSIRWWWNSLKNWLESAKLTYKEYGPKSRPNISIASPPRPYRTRVPIRSKRNYYPRSNYDPQSEQIGVRPLGEDDIR